MNKLFKRVVSIALASALMTSASSAALAAENDDAATAEASVNEAVQDNSPNTDDDEIDDIEDYSGYATGVIDDGFEVDDEHKITSAQDYKEFAGIENTRNGAPCSDELPDALDNSTNENSIYFPPIGGQGSIGSCNAWATTYYQYTYTANRAKGVPTTADNTYSPMWTYNFCNYGEDNGSSPVFVYDVMTKAGVATINDVPLKDSDSNPRNYLSWHATGDIWQHATHNRISDYREFTCTYIQDGVERTSNSPIPPYGTPITDPKDHDLDALKTALNNGDVVYFIADIYGFERKRIVSTDYPGVDNSFAGEFAVYEDCSKNGNHAMTLVGYNDNIWVDVNGNGQVDSGEMGAFKIANSWRNTWCNSGFCWIAYDTLNNKSSVAGFTPNENRTPFFHSAYLISVEDKDYSSNIYLKYTLNTSNRFDTYVTVKATDKTTNETFTDKVVPYSIEQYKFSKDNDRSFSYNGFRGTNGMSSDDGTMYFDLNNIIPDITTETLGNYDWEFTVNAKDAGCPVVVKELKIVSKADNKEYNALWDNEQRVLNGIDGTFVVTGEEINDDYIPLTGTLFISPANIHKPEIGTFDVKTKGGAAPYQYYYEMENYGRKTVISDWTTDSSVDYLFEKSGFFKFNIHVKDAQGNEIILTESRSINNSQFENLAQSMQNGYVGQPVTFMPEFNNTSSLVTPSNFIYTITKNDVSTIYSANDGIAFTWTPSEGGLYSVDCKFVYNSKVYAQRGIPFLVYAENSNAVKIYYKGYETPNIHYCPEGGSWTAVPGIAMTPDTSRAGFTHSYTIDLGDESSYAEVCFNDGNGNWDSRNGANYRFEKGCYTFENGNINKIESGNILNASIEVPSTTLLKGDQVKLKCNVSGGTAPYYFKFTFEAQNGFHEENMLQSYYSNDTITISGNQSFTTTYRAYVIDSQGNSAVVSQDIISNPLQLSLKTDKNIVSPGESVHLSVEANGTLYSLKTRYYTIYDDSNHTTVANISANEDGTAEWTPSNEGTYRVKASLYNPGDRYATAYAEGTVYVGTAPANTVTIYYKGYATPNIHYQVGNGSWTNVPGVAMTPTNEVAGYTHKYTIDLGDADYANVCFNDGHNNWDSRNGANYRFTQGTYKFSNGTITAM